MNKEAEVPPGCPLQAVHKRLEDLHQQWHQAEQAYFDPEAFRIAIQSAIQTARTVTFILQSNKAVIPNFDQWYGKWQEKFKSIPLMRWMVDARNRIEKQGDLEAHSFVRAEIVASYLNNGPSIEVPAKLWDAPLKLVKSIPDTALGTHVKKDGTVRIQRKWIENSLPDYELLEAVAETYGHLSLMLSDAHVHLGLEEPGTTDSKTGEIYDCKSMKGRMPCMVGHSDARTLSVWLADGCPVEIDTINVPFNVEDVEKVVKHYDLAPKRTTPKDAVGALASVFDMARTMFLKDKQHDTIMFLLKKERLVQLSQIAPMEHGEKYLIMRKIAHEAVKMGADGAILVGEVWSAPFDPQKPYQRAVDAPDKEEMLMATLVSKDGEPRQIIAKIHRTGDAVSLGDSVERNGGSQYLFAPLYAVWEKDIPKEWLDIARSDGTN